MCNPQLIMLGISLGLTVVSGAQQKQTADTNAEIARRMAANRRLVGEEEEKDQRRKTAALKGRQAALFGASGAEINTGSSLLILADTAEFGELDALRVRNRAENEAVALENQAQIFNAQGDTALLNAGAQGAGLVASKWGSFGTAGGNPTTTKSPKALSFGASGFSPLT